MKSILWCAAFAAVFAAGCSSDRYYYRTLEGEYAPQTVVPAAVEPAAVVAPAVAPVGGYVEGGYVEPAPVYEYYVTSGPAGDVYEYPPATYYWDRYYRNHHGRIPPPRGPRYRGHRHGIGHMPPGRPQGGPRPQGGENRPPIPRPSAGMNRPQTPRPPAGAGRMPPVKVPPRMRNLPPVRTPRLPPVTRHPPQMRTPKMPPAMRHPTQMRMPRMPSGTRRTR